MLSRLKQYLLIGLVLAGFYFLLSHHFIYTGGTSFDTLKKQELTLKYTFYSLKQASPEAALRIDVLREDGLGELMLEKGLISSEKLDYILRKYDY